MTAPYYLLFLAAVCIGVPAAFGLASITDKFKGREPRDLNEPDVVDALRPPRRGVAERARRPAPTVSGPRFSGAHSRAYSAGRTGGSMPDNQEGMHGGQTPLRLFDQERDTA